MTFDPERDWAELDGGIAAAEVHQQNPNIAPFVARGGKLLLWHGFNDPGPSPLCSSCRASCTAPAAPAPTSSTR
jgi:feruloyl esterase